MGNNSVKVNPYCKYAVRPMDPSWVYIFQQLGGGIDPRFLKHQSGQMIATSHNRFTPKWWFSNGNPLISGKSRLVKY